MGDGESRGFFTNNILIYLFIRYSTQSIARTRVLYGYGTRTVELVLPLVACGHAPRGHAATLSTGIMLPDSATVRTVYVYCTMLNR
jgi:hypothetical protein